MTTTYDTAIEATTRATRHRSYLAYQIAYFYAHGMTTNADVYVANFLAADEAVNERLKEQYAAFLAEQAEAVAS